MNHTLACLSDDVVVDHNIGRVYFGINLHPRLSLKCMFNGAARYVADGRRAFVVDDSSYVILNHGNAYTVEKRSLTPVETFCVFFPPEMPALVQRDLTSASAQLLDDPAATTAIAFNFLEHRRTHGDMVSRRLFRLRSRLVGAALADRVLEEQLLLLMSDMLCSEATVRRRIARLPRTRAATRLELFQRVHRGRDFLHAYQDQQLSLNVVARAAAMSPFHFLRSFRAVFGSTPFAYLSEVRLRRASELLQRTSLSVAEISSSVGFESLPSFTNLFRRTFGQSPGRYRASLRS